LKYPVSEEPRGKSIWKCEPQPYAEKLFETPSTVKLARYSDPRNKEKQ